MRFLLTTLMMLFIVRAVTAQDDGVFFRLHGEVIDEELVVKFDENKFKFKSPDQGNFFSLESDKIFVVKNKNKGQGRTLIKIVFINPLKYTLATDVTQMDDPVFTTVAAFFNGKSEATPSVNMATVKIVTPVKSATARTPAGTSFPGLPRTILLSQWVYELSYVIKKSAKKDSIDALSARIDKIKTAENVLYGKLKYKTDSKALSDWMNDESKSLYDATDYAGFTTALKRAVEVGDSLKRYSEEARKAVENLRSLLDTEFDAVFKPVIDKIDSASKKNKYLPFKNLSASTSVWLKIITEPLLADVDRKVEQYQMKLKLLGDYHARFDVKGEMTSGEYSFSRTLKMNKITLTATPKDFDGVENAKEKVTSTFILVRYEPFVPFISAGVLTTGFEYKNYGVEGGVVKDQGDARVKSRPAAFLNLLTNINSRLLYPFFQIGMANGEGFPIVPIGAGIMLRKFLSVSAGAAFGQRKELPGSLKVGDPIADEATLKARLEEPWHASWYFSINVNFAR